MDWTHIIGFTLTCMVEVMVEPDVGHKARPTRSTALYLLHPSDPEPNAKHVLSRKPNHDENRSPGRAPLVIKNH